MPGTEAPPYSSPFVLDLDMSENPEDPDFDFFDINTPFVTGSSPSAFLAEESAVENYKYSTGIGTPPSATLEQGPLNQPSFAQRKPQILFAPSSASPAGSYQDSSSDSSRYKRKSSSDSSRSALTGKDIMMADADMVDWKVDEMMTGGDGAHFGGFDGTINPSSMNNAFGFNDKAMENDFDFDSAASSPSPFGAGPVDMESPEMPTIKYDTPRKSSPKVKTKFGHHAKVNSVCNSFFTLYIQTCKFTYKLPTNT
jgi:hypothetical protein